MKELCRIMQFKHNIRNVSVVAHVEHGKSILTGTFVTPAGIIQDIQMSDKDEKEHASSIYYDIADSDLTYFNGERDGSRFLLHIIDTPGHVDFSSEVTAALRITDGALVVVDCIKGVSTQTGRVLGQCFQELIKPVVTLNKMDKCFLELQVEGEEAYRSFRRSIEAVNAILATPQDPLLGDVQVYPEEGTVAFSSGLHGWAFTLRKFAKTYSSKFGVDENIMIERLWGENYFDRETNKWVSKNTDSGMCKRGFVQFCYEPIKQIINICMTDQKDKLWSILQKLNVTMEPEDKKLMGKDLMKRVMRKWLPARNTLLEMMIFHLPSPAKAQMYRVENLYEGLPDDIYANAIRNCDSEGPLMLYISKMIPTSDKGRFFAFGRVFSGKVATGLKVRIMGPNYVPGQNRDLYVKRVQRTVIWMGKKQESVEDVPCGNTVAMLGLDQFITKNATLTDEKEVDAHLIRAMKLPVSTTVSVAVKPTVMSELPKLLDALRRLNKSELTVEWKKEDTGEITIQCSGYMHLEKCRKQLEVIMGGERFCVSEPIVPLCETVLHRSSLVMSKSANKCNHLYMQARPLEDGLVDAIERGDIGPKVDQRARNDIHQEFGWATNMAKKIWCFSPSNTGPNILVGNRKGVPSFHDVKEYIIDGFQKASEDGALAGEKMRGICFEVSDVGLAHNKYQRSHGQIIPTAKNCMHSAQLAATPRLLEQVYLAEIEAPEQALGGIYQALHECRGQVIEETYNLASYLITAYLPALESVKFSKLLGAATSGQANTQCTFDHWDMMSSDPLDQDSVAGKLVAVTRKRKGLKALPEISKSEDRLG